MKAKSKCRKYKMKSTTTVILIFVCVVRFTESNAKLIDVLADSIDEKSNINTLNADKSTFVTDNCHEACLQKVCTPLKKYIKKTVFYRVIFIILFFDYVFPFFHIVLHRLHGYFFSPFN